ncbi:exodeoxyribonuclease V subunit gamma [Chitinibacter sp. GC72]|uniref:exodeoxyribonuclease V subunit gamma n=1 Tax=Chitinibacter sp. GC72 TaxID=1526917 RepID=UPI0018DF2395|nr:exodeoxyribonuclease V subunit gamma [Chitinibacter sp. GC72]
MTSRLNIYQSNRLENLFLLLQALFAVPLSDPFASEKIIVSSKGMERWLRFKLADQVGICAGIDFQLPASFVWSLLKDAMPDLQAQSPYSSSPLAWRLFALLPQSQAREDSPIVAAYLAEGDARRRMALAGKLADVFDQYLVFRSHWISEWEAGRLVGLGPDEAWQATLWREIRASIDADFSADEVPHRADMFVQLFSQWQQAGPRKLPERITVFGVAGMPPAYIDVLGALAEHIDVNLFLLNPCREEWGAIVSPKAIAREMVKQQGQQQEAMYLDVGHPLLASMGKAGRDFFRAVTESFPWAGGGEQWLFSDPLESKAEPSLLHTLQSDILNLFNRDAASARVIARTDQSLTFHVCHSAMREVEVLHDRLAAMLAADSNLLASDIAVLLPQMEPYAPLIEAVFGGAKASNAPNIPFNIADLTVQQECPAVAVFLQLMALPESRCKADEIYGLLETPQVAARFGIALSDLPTLRHWITSAGIRWGLDAAHRAEFDLADMGAANTWQAGLDRLLLGLALPNALAGDELPLWSGVPEADLSGTGMSGATVAIAPWDDLEGSQAALLAKLMRFIATLKVWRDALSQACSLLVWRDTALQLLDAFVLFDEGDETQLKLADAIRSAVSELADEAELAGLTESLEQTTSPFIKGGLRGISAPLESTQWLEPAQKSPLAPLRAGGDVEALASSVDQSGDDASSGAHLIPREVVKDWLAHRFETSSRGSGFMSRGVTFCTMVPMRGLPFRVIAVLGLNETDFPRNPPNAGFDLIAQHPQLGDRSRRLDDRYLFLDILLAAREKLYLSWVGRSLKDDAHFPPSVLVSDVLDCVAQGFLLEGDLDSSPEVRREHLLAQLTTQYPLQPFSQTAFQGNTRLQSFNPLWCAAAAQIAAVQLEIETAPPAYPPFSLPAELLLDELAACVCKPAVHFLRYRAFLYLDEIESSLPDDEAFDLKDFRDRRVRDLGLRYGLAAKDLVVAQGDTPLGTPGNLLVDAQLNAADDLRQALQQYRSPAGCAEGELPPQPVDIAISVDGQKTTITGWLSDCYPAGRLVARSQIYSRDVLRAWIEHLALCVSAPTSASPAVAECVIKAETRWLSPERVLFFPALAAEQARDYLADLVRFYHAAMSAPLPFFPKTALAWAQAKRTEKMSEDDARWKAALEKWLPPSFKRAGMSDGEWVEPQNQLLWPDDPLEPIEEGIRPEREQFVHWCEQIVLPMYACLQQRTLDDDLAEFLADGLADGLTEGEGAQ